MATIAVFLALGGVAVAASDALLDKKDVIKPRHLSPALETKLGVADVKPGTYTGSGVIQWVLYPQQAQNIDVEIELIAGDDGIERITTTGSPDLCNTTSPSSADYQDFGTWWEFAARPQYFSNGTFSGENIILANLSQVDEETACALVDTVTLTPAENQPAG
jgi:hypothetical protein